MRKMIYRILLIATIAFGLPVTAQAQMALNKVVIDFSNPASRRDDIRITNTGSETMFVLVEPFQILEPGTKQQKRVKIRDPGKFGLLVTPIRFVLKPRQSKIMRIVVLKPADKKDRIYRLTVKPVVGQVEASQTAVKIVFGYDVLVVVRPNGGKPEIEGKREGKSLTVTNTGTTSALLTNGRQCDKSGENCVDTPPKRIYVGNTWTTPLKYDTPVEYYVTVGTQIRQERF